MEGASGLEAGALIGETLREDTFFGLVKREGRNPASRLRCPGEREHLNLFTP